MTDNTVSPYTVPLGWLPADDHAVVVDALDVVWVPQSDGKWRHGPSGTAYTIDDLWEETDRHPFTRLLTEAEWEAKRPRRKLPLLDSDNVSSWPEEFISQANQWGMLYRDFANTYNAYTLAARAYLASTPEGSKP